MPTAAKAVAAVLFGALAYGVSLLTIPLFPEGTDPGMYAWINAALGVLLGWRVAGSRARTSLSGAVGYGLTAAIAIAVTALFVHSFIFMIRQSLKRLYAGPAEAVVDVFSIMIDNAVMVLKPDVIAAILLGGVVAGLVTEWAGRNFR